MATNDNENSSITRKEIYEGLDQDLHILYETPDGEPRPTIVDGYGDLATLHRIEQFVEAVLASDELGFDIQRQHGEALKKRLPLSKYFTPMIGFLHAYSEFYTYSEYVTVFYDVCAALELEPELFRDPGKRRGEKSSAELFNELIVQVRERGRYRTTKKKKAAREYNARKNLRRLEEYQRRLFERYSRLLVMRIDIGYQKPHAHSPKDLDTVVKDFRRFLNNTRSNKLFRSMVGYVWKLEHGQEKGFHFHLVFFYDGSTAHKGEYLASRIGEYWRDFITGGRGTFYNCNANINKYRKIGIGMIHHSDAERREGLLLALEYLAKKEQYLRVKLGPKGRTFGTGAMPAPRSSSVGRPRMFVDSPVQGRNGPTAHSAVEDSPKYST